MNYWYVWPIGLVLWLGLGWGLFYYFENRALKKTARPDQITLSMFCYTVATKFPLSVLWVGLHVGMLIGGLGVHFLWHWCPPGSTSTGSLHLLPGFISKASAQSGAWPRPYEPQLYRICAVHSGQVHCRLTTNHDLVQQLQQKSRWRIARAAWAAQTRRRMMR